MTEPLVTSKEKEQLREQKQKIGFTDESDYVLEIDKSEKSKEKFEKVTQLDITKPYKYWQLLELCFFKYFNNVAKSERIEQICNLFRTIDDKRACIVGLTNKYIYKDQLMELFKTAKDDIDKLQILDKQEKIEKIYEELLFGTNIHRCSYCNIFDLTVKVRNESNDEIIRYDKQTKKLVNLLTHLNDAHQLKFTKILNIIKKNDY